MTTKTYDIKTDFGAVGNGVADDAPKFDDFRTAALAWQTGHPSDDFQLNIPAGTYKFNTNPWPTGGPLTGLRQVLVSGTSNPSFTGTGLAHLGGLGQYQDGSHSARVATAFAGQSYVDLITLADYTKFIVGQYLLMTGFDIQTYWSLAFGFPSNHHFFEYCLITNVNSGTGRITLSNPLKNTYKSTWPLYSNTSGMDYGGPATAYALYAEWDTQVEWRGVTIAENLQVTGIGRDITFRNVVFTGTGVNVCMFPTLSKTWRWIDSTHTAGGNSMEADKYVEDFIVTGSTILGITFQSSSIDQMTMDRTTLTGGLAGSPKRALITNSNIATMTVGASTYGRSDSFEVYDTVIGSFGTATFHVNSGPTDNGSSTDGSQHVGVENIWSMSNGVIKVPNGATISAVANSGGLIRLTLDSTGGFTTGKYVQLFSLAYNVSNTWTALNKLWQVTVIDSTHMDLVGSDSSELSGKTYVVNSGTIQGGGIGLRWAVPGNFVFWADDNYQAAQGFWILDVTQDANFTYVQTDQTGTFPAHTGNLAYRVHPAPSCTFRRCTGCPEVGDLSLAPAGWPLYSYTRRSLDPTTPTGPYWPLWGRISQMNIVVSTAFTGTGAATISPTNSASNYLRSDFTTQTYAPSVNIKVPGTRTVGSVTPITSYPQSWTGGQSGDTLPDITQSIWSPAFMRNLMTDITAQPGLGPTGYVEIYTDQGVPRPFRGKSLSLSK